MADVEAMDRMALLHQARQIFGIEVSVQSIMEAARGWNQARRGVFPRFFTQNDIDEILLALIEQEES